MSDIVCSEIFKAIFYNDEELFIDMVRHGCANAVDDFGDSVLLDCLDKERVVFFEMLLEAGSDPMAVDYIGNNSLHKSALRGRVDFVLLLIRYQEDLDVLGSDGFTAINYATNLNHWDVVEVLLKAGADPNIPDWFGVSARDRIYRNYRLSDGNVYRERLEQLLEGC